MKARVKAVAGALALAVFVGVMPASADEAKEDDVTTSLLAEYGVNQQEVSKASEGLEDARKKYEDSVTKVDQMEGHLEATNSRLISADQELAVLGIEAKSTAKEIEESNKAIGDMASTMYRQGGVSQDELTGYLLAEGSPTAKLNATMMMTHVMENRSGTLQNQQQLHVIQEAGVLRQEAVREEIGELKANAERLVAEAEVERKAAEQAKTDYEDRLKNARTAASDAKKRYDDAVAKAKLEAEALRKLQAEMLKKANLTSKELKDTKEIAAGNGIFPLPRPSDVDRITSSFGFRPTPAGTIDYGGQGGYVHAGIDYGTPCGTPVRAVADGEVWLAGAAGTAGNAVGLNHGLINGFAFATRYHHMTTVIVTPGEPVKRGDVLGLSGTTGNSSGCHLHFETAVNGQAVNPAAFLG